MDTLHIIAFVFFILFLITVVIGYLIAWLENISSDDETDIIEQARGRPSNAYLFIACVFFLIAFAIEVFVLNIFLVKWAVAL